MKLVNKMGISPCRSCTHGRRRGGVDVLLMCLVVMSPAHCLHQSTSPTPSVGRHGERLQVGVAWRRRLKQWLSMCVESMVGLNAAAVGLARGVAWTEDAPIHYCHSIYSGGSCVNCHHWVRGHC